MSRFVVAMLVLAGCAGKATEPISWENFVASAKRDPESGIYVVDGDEPYLDVASMRGAWLRAIGIGSSEQELAVHTIGGQDDRWPTPGNLTYCIDRAGFGKRYEEVRLAMQQAGAAWNSGCGSAFMHRPDLDDDCDADTPVTFQVERTCHNQYDALAFFPSFARPQRIVRVNCSIHNLEGPETVRSILTHELGHTLGFVHEQIRLSGGGGCPENTTWRGLTSYDSASIMHYRSCGGTGSGEPQLTDRDRQGCRALYGCNNDGTCTGSEDCGTCPGDCPCGPGKICQNSQCVASCPNQICDGDETCGSCPSDCTCGTGEQCAGNHCEPSGPVCPNGVCESGEHCGNCADCACDPGQQCSGNQCVAYDPHCNHNGSCQPSEDCTTCPGDCGCGPNEVCGNHQCEPEFDCGDGTCTAAEDCGSCPVDCGCQPGMHCQGNWCVYDEIGECGDGVCNGPENCWSCEADCDPCWP
jgi:hypothetical protein